ncbi:hypothetical protein [Rothia uropygialis]|uniref:hypothetical protein n=1 Tax=Kocuria sp. 36 TaxID=1415402 RepID=UPI0018767DC5|nr:hypothetical protein [Kocuria sp. 36]
MLALGREAIADVQKVAVALPTAWDGDWVREAVIAPESASDTLIPATGKLGRFLPPSSPRVALGREFGAALARRLPANLRSQFESAAVFAEGDDPVKWVHRTSSLIDLITDPDRAVSVFDGQERRQV